MFEERLAVAVVPVIVVIVIDAYLKCFNMIAGSVGGSVVGNDGIGLPANITITWQIFSFIN